MDAAAFTAWANALIAGKPGTGKSYRLKEAGAGIAINVEPS
jgi:hypothetical protein